MDDISEAIGEIYDAVGDAERWQRLSDRLAAAPRLLPELERHFNIARRAHAQHARLTSDIEALESVHNQLALGALIVDRDGLVLRTNAAATRLLAEADGLTLTMGRVSATDADDDARLHDSIVRAASALVERPDLEAPFILVPRPHRPPLSVLVLAATPSVRSFFENSLPVMLLIIDLDLARLPGPDILRGLFGLTAREAEFAAMLMHGVTVQEAAVALGVTLTTARTFLAHVTAKTDSHSQAELIGRLLAIPRLAAHPA